MVLAAKAVAPIAALKAGIPDVSALIFATLVIAFPLQASAPSAPGSWTSRPLPRRLP